MPVQNTFLGFLDTGGGMTFLFRKPELNTPELNLVYKPENAKDLDFLPKKVVAFYGNDYWRNSMYLFDYVQQKFSFINKIPEALTVYPMLNKKLNYALVHVQFELKKKVFLFDTGAACTRKSKNHGISFLDGLVFDTLKDKYKVIEKYDDDESPCIIIPEIIIFDTVLKNIKFLRRENNAFYKFMSMQTGVKHIGAIGGNVLHHFKIIGDYKNKKFYV